MSIETLFQSLDKQALEKFVADGQEEDLQLDFKTVYDDKLTKREDRRQFAQAVSGYANSSGGIIVWGIIAKPDAAGIDRADDFKLVENAQLLLTRLNDLTGQATIPIVDGIKHRSVVFDALRGCVITLVPESAAGPHMAKLGEDRYYKRSGSSFYKMEHFDLHDMFGRRMRPDLRIIPMFMKGPDGQGTEKWTFSVQNIGRAVAKHAVFFVELDGATIEGANGVTNVTELNHGRVRLSWYNSAGVIHPNGLASHAGYAMIKRASASATVSAHLKVYCEDMKFVEDMWEIPPL